MKNFQLKITLNYYTQHPSPQNIPLPCKVNFVNVYIRTTTYSFIKSRPPMLYYYLLYIYTVVL